MMCAFTFIAKTKSAKYLTLQTAWGAYAPDESTKFNFGVSPEIKLNSDKSELLLLIDQARKMNKNRFRNNADLIFNELIAANKENQFN
ncbi:hypothetical protein [Iodobacter fluviatilis]|uniref:Uncharacterized protein n=1 Tax=Iodobacter fluviatilis TaxID=537 RepID=A0A7G3GFP2_9NEIS|nr:hypothetical protein [Iodobacter fluviatilis]QBC45883.1 hypothetical protein C1H71_20280 [Iodobacter fluviatilis]